MIEVEGLTKHYDGRPAIVDISFTVARGQRLGLVGPAGSGKSTTLRVLAGLLSPTSGSVVVAGHDVRTRSRAARRHVGFLPESAPLFDEMRVEPYLLTMCRLRGVRPGRRRALIEAALERCRLGNHRRAVIGGLPADLRRRVGLAQAVVHEPEVLLLDEPGDVADLIADLGRERAVVMSGPARTEVDGMCDRVLVLDAGRVVADEAPGARREARRGQSVVVVVRGDATAAERHIRGVNGVADVAVEALGDGIQRLMVTGEGDDLQDAVARAIVQHGIGLKELSTRPSGAGEATE
ncbi:MAG TPA: ABC transporter ATP-binding protein [Terriglobales bacterium]|nr:ABC transporter ATP-binding protein [Terriglobales bacterium]